MRKASRTYLNSSTSRVFTRLSRLRSELERVDELESVHSDGEILLHVLWNYPHLPEFTLQRFVNQVPIIVLDDMYDYK